MGKKNFLKFFHFDNLICILWSNLDVSYDSASLVSCWHMYRGQPSQTVLKSVHSLALYDFLKFYLIYYPTAPLKTAVNGAIRKIFACPWIEGPEHRASLGYRPLQELFEAAKMRFNTSLANLPNQMIHQLSHLS